MSLPLSKAGHRYGYLKDRPDHRDYGVSSIPHGVMSMASMPTLVDLEEFCGPVKDQGDLGACTAFAGTGMREFLEMKVYQRRVILSPLFLYYMERKEDGDLGQGDTGSYGRTSCIAMNKYGVCEEAADVYNTANFEVAPDDMQVALALKYKSGAYHRLNAVYDMRSCLVSKYAFVVGFTVYESFESNIGSDGMMPVPDKKNEQVLGGHEVLFIGYDDSKQAFKVRNSWGSNWGANGNFWFPYQCAADSDILMDAWMQHLGKPW